MRQATVTTNLYFDDGQVDLQQLIELRRSPECTNPRDDGKADSIDPASSAERSLWVDFGFGPFDDCAFDKIEALPG